MKRGILIILLVISAVVLLADVVWQEGGVPIRQGMNIEWFRSAATLNDAVIYVWSDTRYAGRDVWAQMVDADGNFVWSEEPLLIDGKDNRQEDPVIIGTTDGCAIIAWVDFSIDNDTGDIFAQKIDANGNLLWAEGGVEVCTASDEQISLNIVPDTNGGAHIIWIDSRNTSKDIYGAHLDSNGNNTWTNNGVQIAGGNGDQYGHTFWEDGQGGALMAYTNDDNGKNVKVLRVDPNGNILWDNILSDANNDQENTKICPLSDGTFALTWRDRRDENNGDIYAQRINLDGNFEWDNELIICNLNGIQENPRIASSEDGAFFITWEDDRVPISYFNNLFIQKIQADGSILWTENGVLIVDENFAQTNPRLVSDGEGGCYVVWDDERNYIPEIDIYIQHFDSDGVAQWEEDGRVICDAPGTQYSPLIKKSGSNIYVNWGDKRNGSDGIYYQAIGSDDSFVFTGDEANGKLVHWGLSGNADDIHLKTDGSKTYIVWKDSRTGSFGAQTYLQVLNSNGTLDHPENGIPFTSSTGEDQDMPNFVIHPDGGAVAIWSSLQNYYNRVFVQYLDADGNQPWGEFGMQLTNLDNDQEEAKLTNYGDGFLAGWSYINEDLFEVHGQYIADGNLQWGEAGKPIATGGSDCILSDVIGNYFVWESQSNIYVKAIDENGDPAEGWTEEGLVVCDAPGLQKDVKGVLVGDDLMLIWLDQRNGFYAIYGQLVNSNGTFAWDEELAIADFDNDQYMADIVYGDEIYVIWSDFVDGNNEQVKVQKIDLTGNLLWDVNGVAVAPQGYAQLESDITPLHDGIFIAWENFLETAEIYMQQVSSSGNPILNTTGEIVCNDIFHQYDPETVTLADENVIVGWQDGRSSGKEAIYGIYVQKYDDPTPEDDNFVINKPVTLNQNYPNPFNLNSDNTRSNFTSISFNLASDQEVQLSVYNLIGQKVVTLLNEERSKGLNTVQWNGTSKTGELLGTGVYFYKLETETESLTRKMLLIK